MNGQVLRMFKNKGQTADKVVFDGSTLMNWVIDLSRPLRGFWVKFYGQLLTSAGTTDPSDNLDTFLKILGTMQLTLNSKDGDIDIIPAGTRVDQFLRFNSQLIKQMQTRTDQGPLGLNQTPLYQGEVGYSGVIGRTGSSPEMFALNMYVPLGFIGGSDSEMDYGMLVPKSGDETLTFTITPGMGTVSKYDPFCGSDRTYQIVGPGGSGQCQAQLILNQIQAVNNPSAGLYLPRYQAKTLDIGTNTGLQNEIYLNNWERGGLWHAISFFEFATGTAAPLNQVNRTIALNPGSIGASGNQSCLRDFFLEANTERVLETDLMTLIAEQHPYPDSNFYNGGAVTSRRPVTPVVLNLAKGNSWNGLYDMTPFITSQLFINMRFDNIQAIPNTQHEYLDVMVLRYQKR